VAGFAKGFAGMGLPLIATPVLAGVLGARPAVVVISIPILVANSTLLLTGWRVVPTVLGRIWVMLVAGALGSLAGAALLARLDQRIFAVVIAALVVFFLLRGERLLGDPGSRRVRVAGPAIGLVGGLLQGSTSIASPLVGSYFHALRVPAKEFVVILAALFELNSIVQIGAFVAFDLITPELLALGIVSLVPSQLGLLLGVELRGRISELAFRRVIALLLILSIVNLLWRAFS
jgi:uncharacterized membrane protein YfcA